MQDTDRAIIDRTLNGDHDAFAVLVDRYKNRMFTYALNKIGDGTAVEDIVQQAFVDAYANLHQLQDRNKFAAWLTRITGGLCYQWWQKHQYRTKYADTYRHTLTQSHQGNATTPELIYMAQDLRARVFHAVENLDPKLREVTVLRYMDDLSYKDIAARIEAPVTTVKGRLRMAKEQMQTALMPMVSDVLQGLRPDAGFTRRVMEVTTMAGAGTGHKLDGPGDLARFASPTGIISDQNGNLYIADYWHHLIRKMDRFGYVTTVAGSGHKGFADGPARSARFYHPTSLARDRSGNLYVGDHHNHRIRKITPDGYVTTIAGSGVKGRTDGPALEAQLCHPGDIIVDNHGYLIFLDSGNSRICRLDASGRIQTIAGRPNEGGWTDGPALSARLGQPRYFTMDRYGVIYFADCFNHCIRKLDLTGTVSTIAGCDTPGFRDGPGDTARFYRPFGITIDADGSLYVTEVERYTERPGNHTIRKIYQRDGVYHVETIAGTGESGFADGPARRAQFYQPGGILINHEGALVISDTGNNRIRRVGAPAAP